MIYDKIKKRYYYFAVKSMLQLYFSEWLKNKKAAINNNNFQNVLHDALNCYNIETNPERISNIEPFIVQYNWKGIKFPSLKEHWKKFKQNNKAIALNILYVPHNTKQMTLGYKSKYNYNCNNQVISLMITDGEKWHYLSIRSLPALLRGITSSHNGYFYCLNCFHSHPHIINLKDIK